MNPDYYCTLLVRWPCLTQYEWAAWVQAIGSILTIFVAIGIGSRQHRQNIELVQDERDRISVEENRQKDALRTVVNDMLRPLIKRADEVEAKLVQQAGSQEPFDGETNRAVNKMKGRLSEAKDSIEDARPMFSIDARHYYLRQQILAAISELSKALDRTKQNDNERRMYPAQVQQRDRFGGQGEIKEANPVDPVLIHKPLLHLKNLVGQVGR